MHGTAEDANGTNRGQKEIIIRKNSSKKFKDRPTSLGMDQDAYNQKNYGKMGVNSLANNTKITNTNDSTKHQAYAINNDESTAYHSEGMTNNSLHGSVRE